MADIDRATLRACSDALAEMGLWEGAARFGELAATAADEVPERMELAWRQCRAGRPDAALAHLKWLADDAHPLVPVLRAAVAATRDRTPAALAVLLREAGGLQPVGVVLRLVVVAALAVGDRAAALDAASRFLATVDADDAEMRRIMAPAQAAAGDIALAASSVECARAGWPADPDQPVREIVDELRAAGSGGAAIRLLADAFHRTGRPGYGELLVADLPRRMLNRERDLLIAMLGVISAIPAAVLLDRVPGPVAAIVALLLAAGGAALFTRALLGRASGSSRDQTNQINKAVALHRRRSGTFSPWTSVAAAVAIVMTFAAIVVGHSDGQLPLTTGLLLVEAVIPVAALAAGAALLVRRRQRSRLAAQEAARVPADRCRCWERDWFGGPVWHAYCSGHLAPAVADDAAGAVLLRCPTTDTTWLHAVDVDLTVRVRLPDGAEREELPTGAYL